MTDSHKKADAAPAVEQGPDSSSEETTSQSAALTYPPYIFGLHESGGESLMLQAGRPGWVLELAAIGLDGASTPADFSRLAQAGLGVIVRINHGYGSTGTLPLPHLYAAFARACAVYVGRSRGCHRWIIGNEPNHEVERPNGQLILPHQYAEAYRLCRDSIRSVPGHENDQVLVAAPGPWNATTTYSGNEKGDWIRYFVDVLALLPTNGCDGFAIHTYTHDLDPRQITGDYFHGAPGYRHLRNEFRTYRDYMLAIPDRFRHLPVYITETDPTTRHKGWNPGNNTGWVQAAYREIAEWNRNPTHQSIQALILYRWPRVPDQPEWSISDRPGIIEDFRQALAASPADLYRVVAPRPPQPLVVLEPGKMLPSQECWFGQVVSPLGLNLRTGPTTQHAVIQILPNETLVTVLAEVDEWLFVTTLGKKGYISRHFVLRMGTPPDESEPTQPGNFLRLRPDLFATPLPAPADQQIPEHLPGENWTEQAVMQAWNRYGGLLQKLAEILQIDVNLTVATLAIESGGNAFSPSNRMLIRFENHIFFEEFGKLDPERFARHFRYDLSRPWEGHQWRPAPNQPWRDFHGNQNAEWEVFTFAQTNFDDRAAKRSISMGAPQIMGFNHEAIGYSDVQEMFVAFSTSAHSQIIGMFDFIQADPNRLTALRDRDLVAFASSYNGPGQAQLFATLIEEGTNALQRLRNRATGLGEPVDPANGSSDSTRSSDRSASKLPLPEHSKALMEADAELYAAWREHIILGFRHNEEMFNRVLRAFIEPYYTTLWMYRILFGVGVASLFVAAGISLWTREVAFGLLFGGLSVAAFLTYFITRPLAALEENLQFVTWLGVIYNSYWARLVYAMKMETIQTDIQGATDDFVENLDRLIATSESVRGKRKAK